MDWITRERPKIDRIACPWLIKRFIDPNANILFVPTDDVLKVAERTGAIPFDIPGVEYSHYADQCTFDYFLKKHQIKDPALARLASIVRGADTDRHDLSMQSAGLEAIFSGLAYNISDDHQLLEIGMIIYDGLYSWSQHLYKKQHSNDSPIENLFLQIYHSYLSKKQKEKSPEWTVAIRELIQDQIDTNTTLSLNQLSEGLDLSPSYLSREFSKYFDNLNYGEYIRKKRIEKSIKLMSDPTLSLTDIAYLTGFSDQSHYTRIFNKFIGCNPSLYRKKILKK
ncbi:chromate resistance protein ChrB domain-containing protein [Sphingobacterium sp.]|uniref:chromate resistance protein ChrB domain-containing protein n=1 Tax=Sphingobacterium sp. TaxID=341027 RepID=UPI0028A09428|nr:chromate resistance protein ChrB domain-containing protein [Sphingobacterium sp.]